MKQIQRAFYDFVSNNPAKSRETVGLTVSRTCTQQGLNRYMFHNCGAAVYGHITCNEIKKAIFIYRSSEANSAMTWGEIRWIALPKSPPVNFHIHTLL